MYKHQEQSYRNRNGVRYECDGDICDTSATGREMAKARVNELKIGGRRAFFEKQDGFYRVFVN
jgi:hypothetical protein